VRQLSWGTRFVLPHGFCTLNAGGPGIRLGRLTFFSTRFHVPHNEASAARQTWRNARISRQNATAASS
jgi:hypothetical protein